MGIAYLSLMKIQWGRRLGITQFFGVEVSHFYHICATFCYPFIANITKIVVTQTTTNARQNLVLAGDTLQSSFVDLTELDG